MCRQGRTDKTKKPKTNFCWQVGKFIQEQAAVYLTAALESMMEEVVVLCLGGGGEC